MSYPTLNFLVTSAEGGVQPIAQASDTQAHPLGKIVTAQDATYGEGEFIYLAGVASTAKGDLVSYNSKTGATSRAVTGGSDSNGPCAIAMADTGAGQFGWYQLSGSGPCNAATTAANTEAYLTSTAGQIDDTGSAPIAGMQIKAATSAGFATVQLNRPSINPAGSGTNTGDVTLTVFGSAPSASGASLSGQILTLQPADATHPGGLSTAAQAIAGAKSFVAEVAPTTDAAVDLGDATHRWRDIYGTTLQDGTQTRASFVAGSQSAFQDGNAAPSAGVSVGFRFNTPAAYPAGSWLAYWYNAAGAKVGWTALGTMDTGYTDTSGTPGAGTANTPSGRSSLSSGSSFDITNACVKATSIILTQIETVDATCKSVKAVPGAGKFTVTATAAPTGTVVFSWVVINGN